MKLLSKLEQLVLGWLKAVPHLPNGVRKWLGDNAWWIAAVGAVLTGISALWTLVALFSNMALLGGPATAYYASTTFVAWLVVTTLVSLVFVIIYCVLFAVAVSPLREKQKKGWVLLFAAWLVGVLEVVVSAVLTLNPLTFITNIIFGALWLAVTGYFLFEIHGQFAHVEKSKGVKAKKVA